MKPFPSPHPRPRPRPHHCLAKAECHRSCARCVPPPPRAARRGADRVGAPVQRRAPHSEALRRGPSRASGMLALLVECPGVSCDLRLPTANGAIELACMHTVPAALCRSGQCRPWSGRHELAWHVAPRLQTADSSEWKKGAIVQSVLAPLTSPTPMSSPPIPLHTRACARTQGARAHTDRDLPMHRVAHSPADMAMAPCYGA